MSICHASSNIIGVSIEARSGTLHELILLTFIWFRRLYLRWTQCYRWQPMSATCISPPQLRHRWCEFYNRLLCLMQKKYSSLFSFSVRNLLHRKNSFLNLSVSAPKNQHFKNWLRAFRYEPNNFLPSCNIDRWSHANQGKSFWDRIRFFYIVKSEPLQMFTLENLPASVAAPSFLPLHTMVCWLTKMKFQFN